MQPGPDQPRGRSEPARALRGRMARDRSHRRSDAAEAEQVRAEACGEKRGEACGGRGGTMAAAAEHTWLREGVHGRHSGGRLIRRPAERDEED